MAESDDDDRATSGSAGHVSVHLGYLHPREVPFSFETQGPRMSGAIGVAGVLHAVVITALAFAAVWLPDAAPLDLRQATEQSISNRIIFLNEPGPGGGGGGGGNRSIEPPRLAQLPGQDKITVPVMKPPEIQPVRSPEDELPTQDFNIPAKQMASAEQTLVGVIDGMASSNSTTSQGSGSGGGAGTGTGTGIGPGSGSGLGPGWGGGFGGGAYRPGSGIELPRLLREVKPNYTADAMRAKIQGTVVLDCVVTADGNVGECEVARSLDSTFGLDHNAVIAAKQWRFTPGKRLGQPVPVLVTIELTFTLR
ncbi:MAG: energy transducer TonB [Acidobacteria bacterium]|nr:energy transducer TonB [Acidobacteriota bacterium]